MDEQITQRQNLASDSQADIDQQFVQTEDTCNWTKQQMEQQTTGISQTTVYETEPSFSQSPNTVSHIQQSLDGSANDQSLPHSQFILSQEELHGSQYSVRLQQIQQQKSRDELHVHLHHKMHADLEKCLPHPAEPELQKHIKNEIQTELEKQTQHQDEVQMALQKQHQDEVQMALQKQHQDEVQMALQKQHQNEAQIVMRNEENEAQVTLQKQHLNEVQLVLQKQQNETQMVLQLQHENETQIMLQKQHLSESDVVLQKQLQSETATVHIERHLRQEIENEAQLLKHQQQEHELANQYAKEIQAWTKSAHNSQEYPINLTQQPVEPVQQILVEQPTHDRPPSSDNLTAPIKPDPAFTEPDRSLETNGPPEMYSERMSESTGRNESVSRLAPSGEDSVSEPVNPGGEKQNPMRLLLEQKQELQDYRNYGLIDQDKILTSVAQEAIEMLAQGHSSEKTGTPEPKTITPTDGAQNESGKHDRNQILNLLNESLVNFCHDNLYFVEFVHITGRFSFNVDNRETIHLIVSQMATPQAFSDTPKQQKTSIKKKPTSKKPTTKITKSPVTATPRKRGRPRKIATDEPAPAPKIKKKLIKVERTSSPDPGTSAGLGQGRRAAAKARQKLTKIVDENIDFNEDSDSETEVPDDDVVSDEDYLPDMDYQAVDNESKHTMMKRRSCDSIEIPQLIKAIKKEIGDDADGKDESDFLDHSDDLDQSNDKSGMKEESSETEHNMDKVESVDHQHMCEYCCKKYGSEEELQKHIEEHKVFTCNEKECQGVKYYTRGDIRKHFRDIHGKQAKQLHRCPKCRQEFLTAEKLKIHMQESYNHICSVCGENFVDKMTLRKHKDSTHLEKTCHICGKNFVSKGAFNRHMKRHREKAAGKIKCLECDKEFTAHSSLFHHKKAVHMGIKPYQCTDCGMTFNFNNSLKLHLLKHSGVRPYKCDVCDKSYLTASHLKNHVQALHSNSKQYSCPVCDKRFPYDNSLKLHMRLHTGDRPYMCALCSKTFVSKSALKVHQSAHVDSKDFKCDICDKTYKTEALMRVHRRRHTSDGSRYMCDICGNTYMYKSNLEVHYEVHGDAKKHQCKVCGKMFKTYPTLYSHYLVHSDKNPFACPSCGKSFKTKERLKAHSIRHSGLKPYVCESCGSSFPDKGGLSKHKKTVHAEVARFACPVCGKPCNRADNLRVHMKVHGDPALLKLSLEELAAASKNPESYTKPASYRNSFNTSGGDLSPVKTISDSQINPDLEQNSASQHSLHMMEAAQDVETMRIPITRPDVYPQQQQPDEVTTVTQQSSADHMQRMTNPQDVMSQMTASAPFMGMHHWGTEGAIHYQNLLLAQGYPTAGMVQAQVQHTENPTTVAYQPTTQHNTNSQY